MSAGLGVPPGNCQVALGNRQAAGVGRVWSIDEMLAPGGLGVVPARLRREDEIEEVFGVVANKAAPKPDGTAPGAGTGGGEGDAGGGGTGHERDELLGWLDRWGMVPGARTGDGEGWEVECPWVGEHTDRAGSGAAYWVGGKFKCHHGHCEGRGWRDLERWVEARVGEESGGLVHVGGWDFGEDVGEAEREAERERSRAAWAREAAEGGSVGAGDARDRFFGELIYVAPEDRFYSVRTGELLARAAVDFVWGADLEPWLPVANGKTGARMAPTRWFGVLARAGSERARVADGVAYWPGEGVWFAEPGGARRLVNRWRPGPGGLGLGVGDADVEPWLRLVRLVCSQDGPGAVEWLLDWFALVVGAPGTKPGWHVVVQGGQGLGKDLMVQPVHWAVGPGNVGSVNAVALTGGFNGFAEKRFCVVHELRQNTRGSATGSDQYEALKELTENTNRTIKINEKFVKPYFALNVCAYYVTSNDARALALEGDDRRFLVVMAGSARETPPWPGTEYAALARWLEVGGEELVAEWLGTRWAEMAEDRRRRLLGRAPETPGRGLLVQAVEDPVVTWTRDKIESGDWPDLMTADDVAREYGAGARNGGHGFRYAPSPQKWGAILRELGAGKVYGGNQVRLKSGKKARLWAIRGEARFAGMGEPALAQAYVSAAGHAFAEEGDTDRVVPITRGKDLPQDAPLPPQSEDGGSETT